MKTSSPKTSPKTLNTYPHVLSGNACKHANLGVVVSQLVKYLKGFYRHSKTSPRLRLAVLQVVRRSFVLLAALRTGTCPDGVSMAGPNPRDCGQFTKDSTGQIVCWTPHVSETISFRAYLQRRKVLRGFYGAYA
jgi:hypothetical protein